MFVMTRHYDRAKRGEQSFQWAAQDLSKALTSPENQQAAIDLRRELPVKRADGTEEDVPVDSIQPGDRLRVRPGENLPVDGTLETGAAEIDDDVAVLDALDGAVDDLADAVLVLGELAIPLGVAHLLHDDLLGVLGCHATEIERRQVLDGVGEVVQLAVRVARMRTGSECPASS